MNQLDLRGVACPMNFVKAKLALEELPSGAELEILLDDGEPIRNVPRGLKNEGHKLTHVEETGDHYTLRLIKN